MTGSRVLPAATAVLAHKRLRDATEALDSKVGGGFYDVGRWAIRRPVLVRDTERRVLGMARKALAQLGGGDRVALAPTSPLGPGPGRFAVLGTAAYDLPTYAGVISGVDHAWIPRVLRSGTPDPNRAHVVVGSSRLALRVGERAVTAGVDGAIARAFAQGMLDAVATEALSSPVMHSLHARRTTKDWRPLDPAAERLGAEHRALTMLGPTGARDWLAFWPGARKVPVELMGAYLGALEDVHAFAAGRASGFPSHDQAMPSNALPTAQDLRAGYGLLRLDLALSTWSMLDWWLFLLPLWVAPSVGMIVGRELSAAGAFFGAGSPNEASVSEMLTLATGLASLPPFVWSMILWGAVPDHTGLFVEALLLFLARLGLTIGWAATTASGSPAAGLRWGLLLPLLGLDVYAGVRAVIDVAGHRPFDGFVRFLQMLPSASGLLTVGLAGLAEAFGVSSTEGFWTYWGASTAALLLLGLIPAAVLRSKGLRGILLGEGSGVRAADAVAGLDDPAIADPADLPLLFDVSTRWSDGEQNQPTLAHLRYPSGTRSLVKVWWEGAGQLFISHDLHTVTLDNGAPVPVEVARHQPTAVALAAALEAALVGVKTQVFDAEVPAPLPWPSALADPGDDRTTREDHDRHAADRVAVGTDREHAHVLRHSPRSELGTRVPVRDGRPVPLVPARGLADLEETALGSAADLAVLLHLGAAPWLEGVDAANPPGVAALPALGKAYEVFRHWNLDHRRVNEWRMLVAGGAESEKGGRAAQTDPGMLAGRLVDSPAAPAGAPVADAMGWVPLWRAWLRVAGDLTADIDAPVTMPYTPTVVRASGASFTPTNADLTAGVRYLLDLP